PLKTALLLLVAAGLGWGAYQGGPPLYRLATDQGRLVVRTDAVGPRLVLRREGRPDVVLDLARGPRFHLRAGEYEASVEAAEGAWQVLPEGFVLERNGEQQLEVVPHAPRELRLLGGYQAPVRRLAVTPDGRFALVAGLHHLGELHARLWNLSTGRETA